jgi:5'-3' exonuclease
MSNLVRLFFGPVLDDSRGEVFFHLAYNGTQYDKAINADNVNSILAEPLFQLMLNKNKTGYTGTDGDKVSDEFKNFMTDVGSYHKKIDDKKAIGADPTKTALLNNVYKNTNLPLHVRKFFDTHLTVFDTVTKRETTDYSDPYKLRFNLVKVSSATADSKNIRFVSTIPLLPNENDVLRTAYSAGSATSVASGNKKFNLNVTELIKNSIIARDTPIPPSSVAAEPLEDLYESVVTGVRYVRDDTGKLRVIGADGRLDMTKDFEQKELEEAIKKDSPNCASTGIDTTNCENVYDCLLSGKPEVLAECLDRLKDSDMFARASKEVAKMNPKVAVQLLRTFGFKPRKEAGTNVVLPPSFDEWIRKLDRTVDVATAKAIHENKKLMLYLRAVVDIVRSNPAIINKDLKSGVSDYARKTGLSVFRNPFPERTVPESVVDGLLFAPQQLAQSMQLPLALQIANLSGRVPFMSGGGVSSDSPNAADLRQAFNLIYAQMEKGGKVLVDSDKGRIDATISKLSKLETQLHKLMDDAKLFAKLHAALTPGQSVSSENVTLNDIVNVKSDSLTGDTLNNLNDYISKNIRDQSQLSADLINKVQMPLLHLLYGRGSDALSRVM